MTEKSLCWLPFYQIGTYVLLGVPYLDSSNTSATMQVILNSYYYISCLGWRYIPSNSKSLEHYKNLHNFTSKSKSLPIHYSKTRNNLKIRLSFFTWLHNFRTADRAQISLQKHFWIFPSLKSIANFLLCEVPCRKL